MTDTRTTAHHPLDKVVAITGAGSGIGRATALALAERGATVVLGARNADRVEQVAAGIRENGGRAVAVPTDVRRRADLVRLTDTAVSAFGRLDVLVNNAGIGPISPLEDLRVDEWDDMIDVNLRGVLHGIAAALPVFRRRRAGHLVTVASTAAYRTAPGQAVYAATKTAVRTVCEGLRQEVGDLRVTIVSPGFVHTDFVNAVADPDARAAMTARRDAIAMDPIAIADAIAYAIAQPDQIDVNEIVVRPTAQR
ncbi:SDR family oxidoreductase [Streptantibioticus cattleyicolor]|uniref:Oxidoreductase n=1 Tax=Streptantibioticus cattleyicolor (strain ATCC 35852 / DSM 46488 / JCM 4925 / NBRC 14057 / NRRL 8057) TaxID=1003195 RepID=F8JLG4_STREN|nr:SDR family oxidoreductase [Streptantibioticus cattleyicolor]AEW98322.1 oxidoreductase [Streptantibioticus cattleyicolor NRRL 8057 = DSM 46488]CCB72620.1 putative enzyme [Streptantibioticus cattleyicolor NRRL 8057 = DSM 46488]